MNDDLNLAIVSIIILHPLNLKENRCQYKKCQCLLNTLLRTVSFSDAKWKRNQYCLVKALNPAYLTQFKLSQLSHVLNNFRQIRDFNT